MIKITFLHFDITDGGSVGNEAPTECGADFVGLDRFSQHCGSISKTWSFVTKTNTINVTFRSGTGQAGTGFLAIYEPTTEPPTYSATGCGDCTFPFEFGISNYKIFDTCTSIDGDQPWCLSNFAPVDQGTHVWRSYCSDTDSTCNRTPQMSTHTNNEPGNCCKFYELRIFSLKT